MYMSVLLWSSGIYVCFAVVQWHLCLFCRGLVAFWGDAVTQVQIWVCLPHPAWRMAKCGPVGGLSLGVADVSAA